MKSGTQTENIGISKGTNTSPGKANPADHPHTDEPVLAISTDDMILDLHSSEKRTNLPSKLVLRKTLLQYIIRDSSSETVLTS
jgi:hypothetical protein